MQPGVSVSAPVSTPTSSPPVAAPASAAVSGNPVLFGNELAKAVAVTMQPGRSVSTANAARDQSESATAQQPTQPQQKASALSVSGVQETPTPAATPSGPQEAAAASAPAPQETPAAPAPSLAQRLADTEPSAAEMASSSLHDAVTGKDNTRDTTSSRRAATRVAAVPSQTDAQATPADAPVPAVSPPVHAAEEVAQPHVTTGTAIGGTKAATTPAITAKTVEPGSASIASPVPRAPSSEASPLAPAAQSDSAPSIDVTATVPPTSTPVASQTTPSGDAGATPAAGSQNPASPAAQIAPVLVRLSHAADGAQRLTVRLDPPELGHVQVSIDRPSDAPARVEITAEKPETLTLLLRDQGQLQHTLDQAGVPSEGRSVTFHIVPSEPASRTEPLAAPAPGVTAGSPGGDGSHGAPRNDGRPQQQKSGGAEGNAEFMPIAAMNWVRAGLDITA